MPFFRYPLSMNFKLVALAPRVIIRDANGVEQLFLSQRVLKLKEDVRIYNNSQKEREVFKLRADRIIDFSATYHFLEADTERKLGSVKRKGMRSLWRATYYSDDANGQQTHHIKEDNAWTKVGDALFSEIPVVGMFSGYVFNPSYTTYRGTDRNDESQPIMRLHKTPSFFESTYVIDLVNPNVPEDEELRVLLALFMVVQLERRRG
ncbi:MAG: hypothetical protein HC915_18615 [Anaerolineae bacterium]|nr:hypothetical protein [Anaerolineae bacterium]